MVCDAWYELSRRRQANLRERRRPERQTQTVRTDHVPPDLNDLDENDQIREVYAWAGLALYMAQVVEHGLVNLLLMARLSDPGLPVEFRSADEFFAHHFRQVMGRLVNAIRKSVDVPADIDQRRSDLQPLAAQGFA